MPGLQPPTNLATARRGGARGSAKATSGGGNFLEKFNNKKKTVDKKRKAQAKARPPPPSPYRTPRKAGSTANTHGLCARGMARGTGVDGQLRGWPLQVQLHSSKMQTIVASSPKGKGAKAHARAPLGAPCPEGPRPPAQGLTEVLALPPPPHRHARPPELAAGGAALLAQSDGLAPAVRPPPAPALRALHLARPASRRSHHACAGRLGRPGAECMPRFLGPDRAARARGRSG